MDAVFIVHVEEDLVNERGPRSRLRVDEQSFQHVAQALEVLSGVFKGLVVNVAVKYGGSVGDRLLRSNLLDMLRSGWEVILHPHGEVYVDGSWTEGPCGPGVVEEGLKALKDVLGVEVRGIVFGDWLITEEGLRAAREMGVSHDASYTPYRFNERFILKPPFILGGVVEVPVAADGLYPINPLLSYVHLLMMHSLARMAHKGRGLIHISIHSYDLFSFQGGRPKLNEKRLERLKEVAAALSDARLLKLSMVEPSYELYVKELRLRRLELAHSMVREVLSKLGLGFKRAG